MFLGALGRVGLGPKPSLPTTRQRQPAFGTPRSTIAPPAATAGGSSPFFPDPSTPRPPGLNGHGRSNGAGTAYRAAPDAVGAVDATSGGYTGTAYTGSSSGGSQPPNSSGSQPPASSNSSGGGGGDVRSDEAATSTGAMPPARPVSGLATDATDAPPGTAAEAGPAAPPEPREGAAQDALDGSGSGSGGGAVRRRRTAHALEAAAAGTGGGGPAAGAAGAEVAAEAEAEAEAEAPPAPKRRSGTRPRATTAPASASALPLATAPAPAPSAAAAAPAAEPLTRTGGNRALSAAAAAATAAEPVAAERASPAATDAAAPAARSSAQRPHPARLRTVTRPLPRVLFLHTGGTLGMDPEEAFEEDAGHNLRVRAGATESSYKGKLRPGDMLSNLLTMVPELEKFANVDLQVLFNKDSSRVGPADWVHMARALDSNRPHYDAFVVVHGTDTMSYTAAALSLMLCGFKKPIVLTGSQLPLRAPRSDARQNLLDSIQVATSAFSPPHVSLQEVAVCFGGKLMRGNRTQKVNSAAYQAFDSLSYPYLATLGIDVDWNTRMLLRAEGAYKPRFKLDPRVIRAPVVPGSDPRTAYGDLYGRGVRGVVLEAFGVGNLPDQASFGWLPWLRDQTAKGLQVCLASQCSVGPLQPSLYRAGQLAEAMGVEAGPAMTPECAAIKLMFCLKHPDLALGVPLAGEM